MRYKIGSFEHLTGISRGSLRYYDKLELLQPHRDDSNSYRYYDEEDLIRLVQIRQYNSFGILLDKLPTYKQEVTCTDMLDIFSQKRAELEATIESLSDKLARMKAHELKFGSLAGKDGVAQPFHMSAIYRLFVTDPEVANHPDTPEIARRWMGYMPYTHSSIRIRRSDFFSHAEGPLPVDIGIGLLKRYFVQLGEEFTPPMLHSPMCRCVPFIVAVEDLRSITKETFEPLVTYLEEKTLMLLGDIYGWIVYITTKGKKPLYHISFHASVG